MEKLTREARVIITYYFLRHPKYANPKPSEVSYAFSSSLSLDRQRHTVITIPIRNGKDVSIPPLGLPCDRGDYVVYDDTIIEVIELKGSERPLLVGCGLFVSEAGSTSFDIYPKFLFHIPPMEFPSASLHTLFHSWVTTPYAVVIVFNDSFGELLWDYR